ncbi:organic hydroperoxide resistance protein [Roseomonas sp. CCTCC AB2023176]|uniref:organic hydroperoxide resistance protein n=1 Tax=Roseomonas sp. CCTCC AB2023176 TaxID=3342640 RepID=UPI0035DC5A47
MAVTDVKYSVGATATGGGRDGRSKSDDGALDVTLAVPKAMGGSGNGNNPEQLFAVGYAACFLGAMRFAASQEKIQLPADTTVSTKIGIGPRPDGGFGITAALQVHIPGMDKAEVQRIVEKGHHICPYSNAIRGNVDVGLEVV